MSRVITSSSRGFLVSGILAVSLNGVVLATAARGADDMQGDTASGATSWSQNCGRCHELRDPVEFRDDLWKPIVTHMRVRAGLTGKQQRDIIAFLRASNNPVSTGLESMAGMPASRSSLSGKEIYNRTCIACHGADGTGVVPGSPDFTAMDGPLSKSDRDLARNILEGFKTPGSPMSMPARGGNPDLDASGARAVLGYLRKSFRK